MKKICIISTLFFIHHILYAVEKADIIECEQTVSALQSVQKNMSPSTLQHYKPSTSKKTKEKCCPLYGAISHSKKSGDFMSQEEYNKTLGCGQSNNSVSNSNNDTLECKQTAQSLQGMRKSASPSTLSYYQADQKTKNKCCGLYGAVHESMKPNVTMDEKTYRESLGCDIAEPNKHDTSNKYAEKSYIATCTQTISSLLNARKGLPAAMADTFKPSLPQKTKILCCPLYSKVYDALPSTLKLSQDDYKKLLDCASQSGEKLVTDMITASTCANVKTNDQYLLGVLQEGDNSNKYGDFTCVDVHKACSDSALTTSANMCAFAACVDVAAHDPVFANKLIHSTTRAYDPHCTNLAHACDDPLFPPDDLPTLCKQYKTVHCSKIMNNVLNTKKYTPKFFDQVIDGISLSDRVVCCPLYNEVNKELQADNPIDYGTYHEYLKCNNLPTIKGFSAQHLADLLSASTCANVNTNDPYLLGVLQDGDNSDNYGDFTCVDVHKACTDSALTTSANMCGLATCIDLHVKDPAFASLLLNSKTKPAYDTHCVNLMTACDDPILDNHPYPTICHDFMIDACIKATKNMVQAEKHAPDYLDAQIVIMNPALKKAGCKLLKELHGITTIPEDKLKNYFSCGKPPTTQADLLNTAYILKCKGFVNSANRLGKINGLLIYGGLKESDREICCGLDFVKTNTQLKHNFLCDVRLNKLTDFIPSSKCANITTNDSNLEAILKTSKNHYNYNCIDIAQACLDPAVTTTTLTNTVCAPGACVDLASQDASFANILTTNQNLSQIYDPHCVNLATACSEPIFKGNSALPLPQTCQTYNLFNGCSNLAAGLIADPSQKAVLDNKYRTLANNLLCCNTPLFLLYDPGFTQLGCKYQLPIPDAPNDANNCKAFAKDGKYLKLPILNTKKEDVTKKVQENCCDTFEFVYYDDVRAALKCGKHKYKEGYHE